MELIGDPLVIERRNLENLFYRSGMVDEHAWQDLIERFGGDGREYGAELTRSKFVEFTREAEHVTG